MGGYKFRLPVCILTKQDQTLNTALSTRPDMKHATIRMRSAQDSSTSAERWSFHLERRDLFLCRDSSESMDSAIVGTSVVSLALGGFDRGVTIETCHLCEEVNGVRRYTKCHQSTRSRYGLPVPLRPIRTRLSQPYECHHPWPRIYTATLPYATAA